MLQKMAFILLILTGITSAQTPAPSPSVNTAPVNTPAVPARKAPVELMVGAVNIEHSPEFGARFAQNLRYELMTRDSLKMVGPIDVKDWTNEQDMGLYTSEVTLRMNLRAPELKSLRVWWGTLGKYRLAVEAEMMWTPPGQKLIRKVVTADSLWWMPLWGVLREEEKPNAQAWKNMQVAIYRKLEKVVADTFVSYYWPKPKIDSTQIKAKK
jgi:hypothetical protein